MAEFVEDFSYHSPAAKKKRNKMAMGLPSFQKGIVAPHAMANSSFGTPGYPSPLDRLRPGELSRSKKPLQSTLMCSGSGLNSFSFSPGFCRGSFAQIDSHQGQWLFKNYIGGNGSGVVFPTSILNPNKAVVTFNSSGLMLTANDTLSLLLGLPVSELCGKRRINEFVLSPRANNILGNLSRDLYSNESSFHTLDEKDAVQDVADPVLFSGKVVLLMSNECKELPVSLWVKQLPLEQESEPRWLAVIEPVDVTIGKGQVSKEGIVLDHDDNFRQIFGFDSKCEMKRIDVHHLIPSLQIQNNDVDTSDQPFKKQHCTGLTRDGTSFPLRAELSILSTENIPMEDQYQLVVWVFSNISGLIVLDEEGRITDYNYNFTRLLFGYGKKILNGKSVTEIIPSFFDDFESGNENVSVTNPSCLSSVPGERQFDAAVDISSSCPIAADRDDSVFSPRTSNGTVVASASLDLHQLETSTEIDLNLPDSLDTSTNNLMDSPGLPHVALQHATSTPRTQNRNSPSLTEPAICEGTFFASARHMDGSALAIIYQIRVMTFGGASSYCIWILRDPEQPREGIDSFSVCSLSLASVFNQSNNFSLGHEIKCRTTVAIDISTDIATSDSSHDSSTSTDGSSGCEYSVADQSLLNKSDASNCSDLSCAEGEFSQHYCVLKQIGKGGFGTAKMCYRKSDGLLVITKFIRKSYIWRDSWVDDVKLGQRIPLEVSLLMTLRHPNIVSALAFYSNDNYCQFVMERCGSGMDLFEFIDRQPRLDEPLTSYIFRQLVSAVVYIHSMGVIHRDIKDENIIIDQHFNVKLIDFGAAVFMAPGIRFHDIVGTMEFASPEVISGESYTGPEVEVWALGVTLFTLMFQANPFYTEDEIITAQLKFPKHVSLEMKSLLQGMLTKEISNRIGVADIYSHSWLKLHCNIHDYSFATVIACNDDELNPKIFITDHYIKAQQKSCVTRALSFSNENNSRLRSSSSSSSSDSSSDSSSSTCSVKSNNSADCVQLSGMAVKSTGFTNPHFNFSDEESV